MRKQFNHFKDFVQSNLSRPDKQDVLSEDVINGEKHLESIKASLANAEKRIGSSLVSTPSDLSSGSANAPERRRKKLGPWALNTCFAEASNLLEATQKESILSKTLVLCAEAQQDSAQVLAEHEMRVEAKCLERLQALSANDLPAISRAKKNLSRAKSDLNAAKTKYESLQKSIQNSAMTMPTDKLDSLRNDVDDAKHRLQQTKDAYEFELLSFLSKEVDISDIFKEHFQLQLEYHRNMLSKLQEYVPKFEGIFVNFSKKPVFGLALEEHLRLTGRRISYVLETCIDLLLDSIYEEGLFRISGSLSKVKLLRSQFNVGSTHWAKGVVEVNAVASTLKSYLRELPEPLLTYQLYDRWMHALAEKDKDQQLRMIYDIVNNHMPNFARDNLAYLIKFLHQLSMHADVNKMSSQNLAIAIGPSLIWPPHQADAELNLNLICQTECSNLIEILISHCDYFFPEEVTFVRSSTSHGRLEPSSTSPINLCDPESPTGVFDPRHSSFAFANISGGRKKPAPKPPQPHLDNFSYDNRIYPKMSSFQSAEASGNGTTEHEYDTVATPLQPPVMPAIPPSVTTNTTNNNNGQPQFANIRRGNMIPRAGGALNTGKARPSSYYERPMVPPPEVPPRPTLLGRNGEHIITGERVDTPELAASPEPDYRSSSSMYPNLRDLPEYEDPSGTDSNDLDDYSGEDSGAGFVPPPPQKPPRLSTSGGHDANNSPPEPSRPDGTDHSTAHPPRTLPHEETYL